MSRMFTQARSKGVDFGVILSLPTTTHIGDTLSPILVFSRLLIRRLWIVVNGVSFPGDGCSFSRAHETYADKRKGSKGKSIPVPKSLGHRSLFLGSFGGEEALWGWRTGCQVRGRFRGVKVVGFFL